MAAQMSLKSAPGVFVIGLFTLMMCLSLYEHAHLVSNSGFVRGFQSHMWTFGGAEGGNRSCCKFSVVKEPLLLNTAQRRFSTFINPPVTPAEHKTLALEEHLGYPSRCEYNLKWIRIQRRHLGAGFNNKIIAFTNLLFYSRLQNFTIVIQPDVYEMMFAHYRAEILQRYFCIAFHMPTRHQSVAFDVKYEQSSHRYFWKTAAKSLGSSDFRFAVAKHIFLRPKAHVASVVDQILAERKWDRYSCVHVRTGFSTYSYMKRRSAQRTCRYCPYTTTFPSEFVSALQTQYGLLEKPIMVMTNNENSSIVQRLEQEHGAIRLTEEDVNGTSLLHVELMLAMFSSLFFGHSSSSMSTNIGIVQQAVQQLHSNSIGQPVTYANTVLPIPVDAFKL